MSKTITDILEDVFNEGYDAGKGVLAEDEEQTERRTIAQAKKDILEALGLVDNAQAKEQE